MIKPELSMTSSWQVIDKTNDRFRMKRTVIAIESAYEENESGLVIGNAKSLVEALCKSLLDEYSVEYNSDMNVSKLAKKAFDVFHISESFEDNQKTCEALKKILSSTCNHFESAIHGMGELRNSFCPIAHGKSSDHKPLDMYYSSFIGIQADSIVGFLFSLRDSYLTKKPVPVIVQDCSFNDFLNEEFNHIQIYNELFTPSDVLFGLKPELYQEMKDERDENLEEVST